MRLAKPFEESLDAVEDAECFVPFVKGEAERVERRAIAAKRCFGLPDGVAVEPRVAARNIAVPVVDRHDQFDVLPDEARIQILGEGSQHWSAATLEGPQGPLIIVNPTHAPTRIKVTLAEELAHLVIGHPPSEINTATGLRTYNRSVEAEAFGVGGALVMPYSQLFWMAKNARPLEEIADAFGVSERLANYRINARVCGGCTTRTERAPSRSGSRFGSLPVGGGVGRSEDGAHFRIALREVRESRKR